MVKMADEEGPTFYTIDPTELHYQEKPMYDGLITQVYQGTYKAIPVAVKITPSTAEKSFNREVEILERLCHPNIVKYVGMIKYAREYMIVTEFVQGGTLRTLFDSCRYSSEPLPLRKTIGYALDIARAMEYVHNEKIIHRDLKLQNILLTENQDKAVLVDFGLAREEDVTGMTVGVGTLKYMAPEVMRNPNGNRQRMLPYDHKADVFSFSIILWQLLTNKFPYEEREMQVRDIFKRVRTHALRPSMEGVNMPVELATLLISCWAANSADRPEFSEIRATLEGLLLTLDQPGEDDQGGDASGTDQDTKQANKKKGRRSNFFKSCFGSASQAA